MFGVVVLQVAQMMRTHFRLLRNGSAGFRVLDAAQSRKVLVGKKKKNLNKGRDNSDDTHFDIDDLDDDSNRDEMEHGEGTNTPLTAAMRTTHEMTWRDLYDILVKWRQLGEPFDTVLWIDCTAAQEDAADKVGLQTHLFHGVGKNIRYYPYFNRTFGLLKDLIPRGYYVGVEQFQFHLPKAERLPQIQAARSLKDILKVLPSLYVFVPLNSTATRDDGELEGMVWCGSAWVGVRAEL